MSVSFGLSVPERILPASSCLPILWGFCTYIRLILSFSHVLAEESGFWGLLSQLQPVWQLSSCEIFHAVLSSPTLPILIVLCLKEHPLTIVSVRFEEGSNVDVYVPASPAKKCV